MTREERIRRALELYAEDQAAWPLRRLSRELGLARSTIHSHVTGRSVSVRNGIDYELDPDTGCWVWQRSRTSHGYGVVRSGGRQDVAHRVYYERHIGPIPEGLQIDHLCRNRACVNPAHLEAVTSAENTRRGSAARLTEQDVRAIREASDSHAVVAARFGVTPAYVRDIRRGRHRHSEAA